MARVALTDELASRFNFDDDALRRALPSFRKKLEAAGCFGQKQPIAASASQNTSVMKSINSSILKKGDRVKYLKPVQGMGGKPLQGEVITELSAGYLVKWDNGSNQRVSAEYLKLIR